jgi:hypothetical protein
MHPLYWLNQVHSAEVQLAICPPLDGSLLDGVTPVIRSDKLAVEIRFTTTLGERDRRSRFHSRKLALARQLI